MTIIYSLDINECDDDSNGGCDTACINTVGSFYCGCDEGYSLDLDGRGCSRMLRFNTRILAIII